MAKTATAKKPTTMLSSKNQNQNQNQNQTSKSKSGTQNNAANDSMLQKFFVDCLKDMYWAEKNIVKTLPKMKKAATSQELQTAFDNHTAQSLVHVERLEQVFALLDETARAKKCEAMEGIIAEGQEIISSTEQGTATRDVGLILAAQKVEHYEIASYGGLAQLARTLGQDEAAQILETTLAEEKETDLLLTDIAESSVNYDALEEDEE